MKIRYFCRQCERQVGELDTAQVDASQLGSDVLNEADQEQTVHMHGNHGLDIRTICDSCSESMGQNTYGRSTDTFS